jgi:type II secretory ATPase GspE/PulE/Tfp pilus assembly ATPase PilB-like protein
MTAETRSLSQQFERRVIAELVKAKLLPPFKKEPGRTPRPPSLDGLLQSGALQKASLTEFLNRRFGIMYTDMTFGRPDPAALALIPQRLSARCHILPLFVEEETLTLASADPFNIPLIDEFQKLTGKQIRLIFALPSSIEKAIATWYEEVEGSSRRAPGALPAPDPAGDPLIGEDPSRPEPAVHEGKTAPEGEDLIGAGTLELYAAPDGLKLDFSVSKEAEQDEVIALSTEKALASESPVVRALDQILMEGIRRQASDIHLEPQRGVSVVRLRVDGELQPIARLPLLQHRSMVSRLKILAGMDIAERRVPQDGSFRVSVEAKNVDCRLSTIPSVFGEKAVCRLLDSSAKAMSLIDLGFERDALAQYQAAIARPHGLILITGPTGSGKSTTLYTTLRAVLDDRLNLMTVEDPVEYQLAGVTQVEVNVKSGLTFARVLRAILRQDPDIIMVGEMRDTETAEICIRSALTGHLVFSTLHTNSALESVTCLKDMGLEAFLIASSLSAVVAQRLLRRLCQHCKIPRKPRKEWADLYGISEDFLQHTPLFQPGGCAVCRGKGFSGRIAVYEVITVDDELRIAIASDPQHVRLQEICKMKGYLLLRDAGLIQVSKGVTTLEEVVATTV